MVTLGATLRTTSVRVLSTGGLTPVPSSTVSVTVYVPLPSSLKSILNSKVLSPKPGLSHSCAMPLPQSTPIIGAAFGSGALNVPLTTAVWPSSIGVVRATVVNDGDVSANATGVPNGKPNPPSATNRAAATTLRTCTFIPEPPPGIAAQRETS